MRFTKLRAAAAALVVAGLVGCAGSRNDAAPEPEPGLADAVDDLRRIAQEVAAHLEALRDARGLPGVSAAIILPDGFEVAVAVGQASREDGTGLETRDLLLSGSVGKTYVAALTLALVEDGVLSLDEPLGTYLGDRAWFARLPNADALTLRHLLRHQSGLARYVFARDFWEAALADRDRVWEPDELVAFVLDRPAAFAPGEGFAYSDTNYVLVGMAMMSATGRDFYQLVRERLLEPHELADTRPSDSRDIPGLVQGYDELFGALGVPDRALGPDGRFSINPQFEWCGGGYANTPLDLARWASLLYSGAAFDGDYLPELLDAVAAPQLGPDVRYGPAMMVRETELGELRGHDGVMIGYSARMGWFPEHDVAVAVMTNASKSGALDGLDGDVLVELARIALHDAGAR